MYSSNPTADPIALLQSARESFRKRYSHLSHEDLEQEWALLCSTGGSFETNSRAETPRSLSMPMSWSSTPPTSTSDISRAHEMNRQQAQSYPLMLSRDHSDNSFLTHQNTMGTWQSGPEPYSAYQPTYHSNGRKRKWQQHMPQVIEAATFEPSEYLAKINCDDSVSATAISHNYEFQQHGLPPQDASRLSVTEYTYASPTDSSPGSSPMSAALTNASTFSSVDMSRNTSTASFTHAFDRMHMQPDVSYSSMSASHSDEPLDSSTSQPHLTPHDVSRSHSDSNVLPSRRHRSSRSFANFTSSDNVHSTSAQSQSYHIAPSMHRSDSSQSNTSNSSNLSLARSSRRRHEQLQQERPIAPKASASTTIETEKMTRIHSEDGSYKDYGVIPRKEKAYQRPQHPKLFCNYCEDHPDGFRGEHELQRHTNRAHAKTRKVWICVDSSPDSKFLANCKACRTSKRYGAYYNAAAHLRRAHFNPRKRGRKAKTDAEKRGGKGGGNWPAMDLLKEQWMREIDEVVNEQTQPLTDDDEQFDNDNTDPTSVSHDAFTYDSTTPVDNTFDPTSYVNNTDPVNFDSTFVDTSYTGTFEIPSLSCADNLMSQATGLSNSFYPHITYDESVFQMSDESYQQQQSAAAYF